MSSGEPAGGAAAFATPEIYDFPPFFTCVSRSSRNPAAATLTPRSARAAPRRRLQPVADTRSKQLQMWQTLIVDWHRAHRQFTMALDDWPLFENASISRPSRAAPSRANTRW